MSDETSQEAFEQFIPTHHHNLQAYHRCDGTRMQNAYVGDNTLWDAAWQASRKQALDEAAKRSDAYAYMSENFTALSEEIRRMK